MCIMMYHVSCNENNSLSRASDLHQFKQTDDVLPVLTMVIKDSLLQFFLRLIFDEKIFKEETSTLGCPPPPSNSGNEGLGWDSLLKMVHNPGGDSYWEGRQPNIYL